MSDNGYTRYRIGVINDFRNETGFVDYQEYMHGEVKHWNASRCGIATEHQKSDDAIHIFLNFKKLYVVKSNAEAESKITELLRNAPIDLSDYKRYLIREL